MEGFDLFKNTLYSQMIVRADIENIGVIKMCFHIS